MPPDASLQGKRPVPQVAVLWALIIDDLEGLRTNDLRGDWLSRGHLVKQCLELMELVLEQLDPVFILHTLVLHSEASTLKGARRPAPTVRWRRLCPSVRATFGNTRDRQTRVKQRGVTQNVQHAQQSRLVDGALPQPASAHGPIEWMENARWGDLPASLR